MICAQRRLQQLYFFLAADQWGETCRPQSLETAGNSTLANDAPGTHWLGKAFQPRRLDWFVFKIVASEPPRHCGNDHRVRRRRRLQPRGEVRRLADDVALLHLARSEQFADHDEAGGDADAHLMAAFGEKLVYGIDQREARAHRVFDVNFMRFGIAEIHQHAVAHIFGDVAAEATDHPGRAFVVCGDHVAQIFRIKLCRERRRADEIAEHHRDLAALGRGCGARYGWRHGRGEICRRGNWRGFAELGTALRAKA